MTLFPISGNIRMNAECLQLAPLFDFLEDVRAWVKDKQGRYYWVNRAFLMSREAVNGRVEKEEVLGRTDYDLSPEFLADQFRLDDEQVLKGEVIVNRIEMVILPDGRAAWHLTNKIPLRRKSGKVIGTAGTTRPLNPLVDLEPELGRVLAHMGEHYSEPLSNKDMAKMAGMSLRAFERKFQGEFHATPQHYLRRLRLRMASRALVNTNQPISQVAQSCGFSDQSHFTREFRSHFGSTPREYRLRYVAP
jgi:AraC-like DNA-binding protein